MIRLFCIGLILITFSSCRYFLGEKVRGDGNVTTTNINTGSFNSVEVGGALQVRIQQDASPSARVETDKNLVEYLDIYVEGNTLVIEPQQGYRLLPTKDIIVYVSAPQFKSIHASGASSIVSSNIISGNELELDASGASKVEIQVSIPKLNAQASGASDILLKGTTVDANISLSGASEVKSFDLGGENITLDLSGASSAEINASRQVKIEASGASHVRYKGNPSVSSNTSGASSVERAG